MRNLPKGWEWKKLSEICDVRDGTHDSPKYVQEGYPLITSKNISNGIIDFSEVNLISEEDFIKVNKRSKVDKGDIIMPMIGTIGNPIIVETDKQFAIKNVALIKFNNNKIINKYLKFLLDSSYFTEITSRNKRGGTQKFIALGDIRNFLIPLPPLLIQEKIVSILERAESLKQKREQANEDTNRIIQSIFYKMFGDGKYPNEEILNHIEETSSRDPTKKTDEVFKYVDIAGIENQTGQIKEAKEIVGEDAPSRARKVIKENDVIVSTVRPNLNATALIPKILDNQIASTGFCVIRCKKTLNPKYIFTITRQKKFIDSLVSKMKGASYPAVTNNDILKFKIPIPPISLQNQFASIVEKIESIKQKQNQATAEISTLFDALMQKAFNGELVG